MIIVMSPEATEQQVEQLTTRVQSLGLKAVLLKGTNRRVIACIGDERAVDMEPLGAAPGVESVKPILAPYKIASRETKREPTIIPLNGHTLGGPRVGIIAGPCTIESREQIVETASFVREHGAVAIRGGAFKPRTNPYTFQGMMEKGLELLAEAREKTGLSVVTEVMSPEQAPLVAKYADVLQVGTRNMQNFALLRAVGQTGKPVLLKRGMSATLEEFLLAAEYILATGNHQVILCERGIRTFETHTRFTLSLSMVPSLKEKTHLPIIVEPMARAAVAAGADGIMVEVHPQPDQAILDGAQSINLQQFAAMMKELKAIAEAIGREM